MKKFLLLLLVGFIAVPVFAQKLKVKTKDKVVYINDEAFLKWEGGGVFSTTNTFTHASGDSPAFVIHYHKYGERNFFTNLRFLDFDGEMWDGSTPRKKFYANLYKANVFNKDCTVNEENARRFIRMYHEEPPTRFMIGQ